MNTNNTRPTHRRGSANALWLGAVVVVTLLWVGAFVMRGGEKVALEGWADGLDAGMAQAAEAGQPMVVLFTADWCGPCQSLKKAVLSQPEVDKALRHAFVPVVVDLTDGSSSNPNLAVAREYGVSGIPSVIAMDAEGTPIDAFAGERSPAGFTDWLAQIER